MNSFLVHGGDQQSRSQYLADLQKAGPIELIHLVAEKTSLTIKQVKDLASPLSIEARIPRIVWIEEANLLTIPAQNALLKILEEPPRNTRFYLTCQTATSLLPTICSRTLATKLDSTSSSNTSQLQELKSIMAQSPGDRLQNIPKMDRSEAIIYLSQMEQEIKQKLYTKNLTPQNLKILAEIAVSLEYCLGALRKNASLSLILQHFYLRLPHTHSPK